MRVLPEPILKHKRASAQHVEDHLSKDCFCSLCLEFRASHVKYHILGPILYPVPFPVIFKTLLSCSAGVFECGYIPHGRHRLP